LVTFFSLLQGVVERFPPPPPPLFFLFGSAAFPVHYNLLCFQVAVLPEKIVA
jgi:hypothetical protein